MRRAVFVCIVASVLSGCGSAPKETAETPGSSKPAPPRAAPKDESARFPKPNLTGTQVVPEHLGGKEFMPGGTLAEYRKGRKQYSMFVAKAASPTDAAILLNDWRKALKSPKLVASFGGYFGEDAGQPVFVFTKGDWVAGIRGLDEKSADAEARVLAARL